MNADQTEKLKALALAVKDLPDTTQPFVSSTGQVLIGTFSLKGEQLNTVARFYDAAGPDAVAELIGKYQNLKIERDTLRHGYTSAAQRVIELEAEVERLRAEKAAPDLHVIPPTRGTGSQLDSDLVDLFRLTLGTLALHDWREAEKIGAQYRAIEAELATRCRVEGGNTSDKPDDFRSAPWYLTACKMGNAFYNLSQRDDLPPGWNETARGLVEEWDEARKSIGSGGAAGTDKDAERYRLMSAQLSSGDLNYYRLEGEPQAFIDEYCDAEIEAHTKAGKPT